jgi:hypothetical protein
MEVFQKRIIIAYFVGGHQLPKILQKWAVAMLTELKEVCKVGRELGVGFFQLITKDEATSQES